MTEPTDEPIPTDEEIQQMWDAEVARRRRRLAEEMRQAGIARESKPQREGAPE